MTTAAATIAPKTSARTCPNCHGTGRHTHYSALGNSTGRCPMCRGTKTVTAKQWLTVFSAMPRTLTREDAIAECATAIGMDYRTGGDIYGGYVGDIRGAGNGDAGLVVDMEESGLHTVCARYLAKRAALAVAHETDRIVTMVAEVRAARAEMRAAR
jgi:DnaJ-class molecular chaperone